MHANQYINTWTQEQIDFLKDKSQKLSWMDLTKLFNKTFDIKRTMSNLRYKCSVLGIKKKSITKPAYNKTIFTEIEEKWLIDNFKKYHNNDSFTKLSSDFKQKFGRYVSRTTILKYLRSKGYFYSKMSIKRMSDEQKQFLINNYNNYNLKDLLLMFNKEFNEQWEMQQLRWAGYKLNIKRTKEAMQKSYSDKSAVEIGSIRKYKNFVYVKTKNDIYEGKGCRKNWKCYSLNRYLWEQHYNEKLLDNESIIPLDGNKNNHNIDNLCKVDMSLKVKLLNQNAYGKKIITKAMISVLELEKEIQKEKDENEKRGYVSLFDF